MLAGIRGASGTLTGGGASGTLFEPGKASGPKKRDAKRPRRKARVINFIFGEPDVFLFIPKLSSSILIQKFNEFCRFCQGPIPSWSSQFGNVRFLLAPETDYAIQ
jgi:hypothetical protein